MIKADHKRWARYIFNVYIEKQLRGHFSHFYMLNEVPDVKDGETVIFCPNHFSWWDGFLIDRIYRSFYRKKKFYIMMLEEQLKKLWFFGKLGAYSINQTNPRSIIDTIKYTKAIIRGEEAFIAIYPQGEYQQVDPEKIKLKRGLIKIVNGLDDKLKIVPIAFDFKSGEEKLPKIYVRSGRIFYPKEIERDFDGFESEFRQNLALLKQECFNTKPLKDLI